MAEQVRTGRFYTKGFNVFREPIDRVNDEGKVTGCSMGYRICTINDGMSGEAATVVANALNHYLDAGLLK